MHITVILAHPSPLSFNHAIASSVVDELTTLDHTVVLYDLYKEQYQPVLDKIELSEKDSIPKDIESYCTELGRTDGIIVVHPNWWGQPPAVLKGWIDRVFRAGVAYRFIEGDTGEGVPLGLLKAKAAVVFNTSNTKSEREAAIFGDPLETIWKNCIFDLCGVKTFYRKMFCVMVTSTQQEREEWLAETRAIVRKYFPAQEVF